MESKAEALDKIRSPKLMETKFMESKALALDGSKMV